MNEQNKNPGEAIKQWWDNNIANKFQKANLKMKQEIEELIKNLDADKSETITYRVSVGSLLVKGGKRGGKRGGNTKGGKKGGARRKTTAP